jgi:6-pyruvoyltetrahydropterin/6-carboxytetrahydropterin synthase
MYYYLCLGSAIQPEANCAGIVRKLCHRFGEVYLFPLRYTEPELVKDVNVFINGLAVIAFEGNEAELKLILVELERSLGRDRSVKAKVSCGWTADIDIVGHSENMEMDVFDQPSPNYLRAVFQAQGSIPDTRAHGLPMFQEHVIANVDAQHKIQLSHAGNQAPQAQKQRSQNAMVRLNLEKQRFHFSAGHFTIFADGSREKVHGHNYYLAVELSYDKDKVVFDYNSVKHALTEICESLDERFLIAEDNEHIRIEQREPEFIFYFKDDKFLMPCDDVVSLPIKNTTVEELVVYLANIVDLNLGPEYSRIQLKLSSGPGQSCLYCVRDL